MTFCTKFTCSVTHILTRHFISTLQIVEKYHTKLLIVALWFLFYFFFCGRIITLNFPWRKDMWSWNSKATCGSLLSSTRMVNGIISLLDRVKGKIHLIWFYQLVFFFFFGIQMFYGNLAIVTWPTELLSY